MNKNRFQRRKERNRKKTAGVALKPRTPMASRSAELLAVERFDRFAGLRHALAQVGVEKDEWAGIPMPLSGEELIVEPTYAYAAAFKHPEFVGPHECRERNRFWSEHLHSTVVVVEYRGAIRCDVIPGVHSLKYAIGTLGCSDAWGVEQESNAIHLLGTMVRHHTFKHYLLTGMFLEKSARTNITYLFRRLKPTVAIVERKDEMVILAALCMHPIGYYAGTWGGAMCPTDDVIAHLALMRGDEPMFWRRCNQHHPSRPEAGL